MAVLRLCAAVLQRRGHYGAHTAHKYGVLIRVPAVAVRRAAAGSLNMRLSASGRTPLDPACSHSSVLVVPSLWQAGWKAGGSLKTCEARSFHRKGSDGRLDVKVTGLLQQPFAAGEGTGRELRLAHALSILRTSQPHHTRSFSITAISAHPLAISPRNLAISTRGASAASAVCAPLLHVDLYKTWIPMLGTSIELLAQSNFRRWTSLHRRRAVASTRSTREPRVCPSTPGVALCAYDRGRPAGVAQADLSAL